MRMRRKRNLSERIDACTNLIHADLSEKNMLIASKERNHILDFKAIFGNDHPVYLEIGCGKGGYVIEKALRHPEYNYVAVEMISNVIVEPCERCMDEGINNILFLNTRAECLESYVPAHSIRGIILNFSTPLPKKGYEKQRLTHARFLSIYRELLKEDGTIQQRTDDRQFFAFSIEQFSKSGFYLTDVTLDKHADAPDGDVITEHEQRFMNEGKPIYQLIAHLL